MWHYVASDRLGGRVYGLQRQEVGHKGSTALPGVQLRRFRGRWPERCWHKLLNIAKTHVHSGVKHGCYTQQRKHTASGQTQTETHKGAHYRNTRVTHTDTHTHSVWVKVCYGVARHRHLDAVLVGRAQQQRPAFWVQVRVLTLEVFGEDQQSFLVGGVHAVGLRTQRVQVQGRAVGDRKWVMGWWMWWRRSAGSPRVRSLLDPGS